LKGDALLGQQRLQAPAKAILLIPGGNDDIDRYFGVVSFHQNRVIIRG
jgi:hypothetical protein